VIYTSTATAYFLTVRLCYEDIAALASTGTYVYDSYKGIDRHVCRYIHKEIYRDLYIYG